MASLASDTTHSSDHTTPTVYKTPTHPRASQVISASCRVYQPRRYPKIAANKRLKRHFQALFQGTHRMYLKNGNRGKSGVGPNEDKKKSPREGTHARNAVTLTLSSPTHIHGNPYPQPPQPTSTPKCRCCPLFGAKSKSRSACSRRPRTCPAISPSASAGPPQRGPWRRATPGKPMIPTVDATKPCSSPRSSPAAIAGRTGQRGQTRVGFEGDSPRANGG